MASEFSGVSSHRHAGSAAEPSSSGGGGYTDQQSAADSLRLQEEYLNEHPITYDPLSGRFMQSGNCCFCIPNSCRLNHCKWNCCCCIMAKAKQGNPRVDTSRGTCDF